MASEQTQSNLPAHKKQESNSSANIKIASEEQIKTFKPDGTVIIKHRIIYK